MASARAACASNCAAASSVNSARKLNLRGKNRPAPPRLCRRRRQGQYCLKRYRTVFASSVPKAARPIPPGTVTASSGRASPWISRPMAAPNMLLWKVARLAVVPRPSCGLEGIKAAELAINCGAKTGGPRQAPVRASWPCRRYHRERCCRKRSYRHWGCSPPRR